ncbi:MAG: HNH endonuclease [Desulfovibrionaceae bacterium]|nr:HNH endonuclease [Desulfovibrionaceae bacterium]
MLNFTLILGTSPKQLSRKKHPLKREEEQEFELHRVLALKRDRYRCQGCGIEVDEKNGHAQGLEVHHINYDPHCNQLDNLITLCPLCHGTQHLGFFGRRFAKVMQVIFCEELSQKELNLLSWTMAIVLYRTKDLLEPKALELKRKALDLRKILIEQQEFPDDFLAEAKGQEVWQKIRDSPEGRVVILARILALIRHKNPMFYKQREVWLKNVKVFYDPKAYESFQDNFGHNMVEALSKKIAWQPGENWVEAWFTIGKDLARLTAK